MKPHHPTVGQFMTNEPVGADVSLPLLDANERMFMNNIRHLVIHNGSEVSGILSTRDVALALSMATDPKKITAGDAMIREPYTCSPDTPLAEVVEEMEKHRYGCAIVTDGDDLVGIFTTTDALRAVRALIAGHPVAAATIPRPAEPHHPIHTPRRVRLGRLKPLEGTHFLGHRIA